jgi:hypothetical protein
MDQAERHFHPPNETPAERALQSRSDKGRRQLSHNHRKKRRRPKPPLRLRLDAVLLCRGQLAGGLRRKLGHSDSRLRERSLPLSWAFHDRFGFGQKIATQQFDGVQICGPRGFPVDRQRSRHESGNRMMRAITSTDASPADPWRRRVQEPHLHATATYGGGA